MLKIRISKNNIIILLSIILITISFFIKINEIHDNKKEQIKEQKAINEVINDNQEKNITSESNTTYKKQNKAYKSNYIAVLEIPKINLKKGLVLSTKNFKSINYAISIDKNSKFPDEIGNFILYAHSGNSKISYFDKIKYLDISDKVRIFYNDNWYNYQVIKKYEINKNGKLSIYNDGVSKYITLTTCSQQNKGKQIVVIGKEM